MLFLNSSIYFNIRFVGQNNLIYVCFIRNQKNGSKLKTVTFHAACVHCERIFWLTLEKIMFINKEVRSESKLEYEYEKSEMSHYLN